VIVKKPYGVSSDIEVTIDGSEVSYTSINSVELHLEENMHDMLVLVVTGIPPKAITDYYGKAVSFRMISGRTTSHEFLGYVEDVRPYSFTGFGLINNSPFQETRIVCMGASYNMRGSTSRVWRNFRISDIARDMCDKYKFSLDVPKDDLYIDNVAQTNESDWQFLTRYCTHFGYSVTVHSTHMHVFDPYNALSRQNSVHVLETLKSAKGDPTPRPGQILKFEGSFSRRHADGHYKETIVSVLKEDNSLGELSSSTVDLRTNGMARYPNRVSSYSDNFAEARRRISAVSKEKYDYYADVQVLGIANCVPGGIVEVGDYSSDFDGFWYVQKVSHTLDSDKFITDLQIAKNLNTELIFNNTKKFQNPPSATYRNGVWMTTEKRVNEYS